MKLSILQNKLKEALSSIERIASKSPSLPILGNVLLEAKGNFLKLSATNLETGINFWLLAKIEKEGRITVPAHIFANFISLLPSSTINIKEDKGILSIECEGTKTRINGLSPEDFPIIPKIETEEKVSLSSLSLSQGLSQIINVSSISSIKPEISGIHFSFQKDCLTIAATDSFRLGEKKILFKKSVDISKEYSFILPHKSASLFTTIFGEKDIPISICFSPNLVMFESLVKEDGQPKIELISKLIEGEYPEYQEIIPRSFKTKAIINRKDFLLHLKAASIFASRINEVKIKFLPDNQKIEIFCQNPELGEHSSVFSSEIEGRDTEVSFNYKFLLDGLLSVGGEKVFFALSEDGNNEDGPAILKDSLDETYLYVAMPIQAA